MTYRVMTSYRQDTPFKHASDIHDILKSDLERIKNDDVPLTESEVQTKLNCLCKWLCTTPKNTTYRVNLLKATGEVVLDCVKDKLTEYGRPLPSILTVPEIPELILIRCWDESVELDLKNYASEIIVDAACGAAVLRGSHVFAPGIIGMPHGLVEGDKVSVYADVTGKCTKGLVNHYADDNKLFVGNGIVKMTRQRLFDNNASAVSGIAIYMTDTVSRLPQLNDRTVPEGCALLQNLPSIICSYALNPQPGDIVLDMCAAPGNKTTHISNLMKGQGTVIALDKNESRTKKMVENCKKFSANNVQIYSCDATKTAYNNEAKYITEGPSFKDNYFVKILLDAPCSGLGQRPQLLNVITAKQLHSYVPLQRQLFSTAARLLKQNGILVYSTCTVTIAENEGIVSWALKVFPDLELIDINDRIPLNNYGTHGYPIDGLTKENANKLRRFGPETDSVGFFIACFSKRNVLKDN